MPKQDFPVDSSNDENSRLDVFLSSRLSGISRSQVQKLIESGRVRTNGFLRKSSYRLQVGESVQVDYEEEVESGLEAEDIPLDIVHADDTIAIVNKPSGLVVHPGAGNREHTLVNALLYAFPQVKHVGDPQRPGIVHRLDKETSGVLIVALTELSHSELQRQFKAREVEKKYYGLVWGGFIEKEGKIDWPIGRHRRHGERISVRTDKPREAETHYSVEGSYGDQTLLLLKPLTGRTHQLRVHLAASGHPIVADSRYGGKKKTKCPRLFLHASTIEFSHPRTGEKVCYAAPLPPDLQDYLNRLSHLPS